MLAVLQKRILKKPTKWQKRQLEGIQAGEGQVTDGVKGEIDA